MAFAAVLVLASCEKMNSNIESRNEDSEEQQTVSDIRTVTVSFGSKATRTAYDINETSGILHPYFTGDGSEYIALVRKDYEVDPDSDDETLYHQDIQVKKDGNRAYIEIPDGWDGDFIAIYPASCAYVDYDGEDNIVYADILVWNSQTGEFADANICMANFSIDDDIAVFENQTALFIVTEIPFGTKSLNFKSLCTINPNTGQRALGTAVRISEDDENYYSDINVINESGIPNPCFIAVKVGIRDAYLNLEDVNIDISEYVNGDRDPRGWHKQGGFPPKLLLERLQPANWVVGAGNVYRCSANSLHEYICPGDTKVACLDIGATEEKPTDCEYFAWGDITGYKSSDLGTGDEQHSFTWENCPLNGGNSTATYAAYNTAKNNAIKNNTLRLKNTVNGDPTYYDAAFYNWGGAWRLPTSAEICSSASDWQLTENEGTKDYSFNNSGRYIQFDDGTKYFGNQNLYFYLVGYADGTSVKGITSGLNCYYRTSSVPTSSKVFNASACHSVYVFTVPLNGDPSMVTTQIEDGNRRVGLPIRPVSGPEAAYD